MQDWQLAGGEWTIEPLVTSCCVSVPGGWTQDHGEMFSATDREAVCGSYHHGEGEGRCLIPITGRRWIPATICSIVGTVLSESSVSSYEPLIALWVFDQKEGDCRSGCYVALTSICTHMQSRYTVKNGYGSSQPCRCREVVTEFCGLFYNVLGRGCFCIDRAMMQSLFKLLFLVSRLLNQFLQAIIRGEILCLPGKHSYSLKTI